MFFLVTVPWDKEHLDALFDFDRYNDSTFAQFAVANESHKLKEDMEDKLAKLLKILCQRVAVPLVGWIETVNSKS